LRQLVFFGILVIQNVEIFCKVRCTSQKGDNMSRTTREEHNRICEQCQRVEKELERLRVVLNDAEDQVKKLEVKMFPGRNRMLRDAAEREADARAAYSDAQHRLDDIKRQERLLRMKMRREESDVSVDDIPEVDVDDIPDATMEDIQDVEIDDVPVIEVADMNMPDVDHVVVDVDEPEREEPVAETTPEIPAMVSGSSTENRRLPWSSTLQFIVNV